MLTKAEVKSLKLFCAETRKATIQSINKAGGGHIGGAMSTVEVLSVLYNKQMKIDPQNPKMEGRDRFVLSKGHCGPSLYATLALKGYFPKEALWTLNQANTILPSHCDRLKTPGIDFSTGSLGQGIGMAVGSAVGARHMGKDYYTYCIIGDGECNEGQVWEATLFAAHHKMDNLIVFADLNKQQLDGLTEEICGLGDLAAKFDQFGWFVQKVNGHDVEAIDAAICAAKEQRGRPSMIVLDTIKGYGCEFATSQKLCHHLAISDEVCAKELARLDAEIAQLKEEV